MSKLPPKLGREEANSTLKNYAKNQQSWEMCHLLQQALFLIASVKGLAQLAKPRVQVEGQGYIWLLSVLAEEY